MVWLSGFCLCQETALKCIFFGVVDFKSLTLTVCILVQQSADVSLSGLPVLRTLYNPMPMHETTNDQKCKFCVFKGCSF